MQMEQEGVYQSQINQSATIQKGDNKLLSSNVKNDDDDVLITQQINNKQSKAKTAISYDNQNTLQAEIYVQSERYCQQFNSNIYQIKSQVNQFINNITKSNCIKIPSTSQTDKKYLTYSKAQQSTQQSLSKIKKRIQQTTKQSQQLQKYQLSKLKQKQKLFFILSQQLQEDNFKLVKTLFAYYYTAYSHVEVIIKKLIYNKKYNNDHKQIFPDFYITNSQETLQTIHINEISFPPVVCENDFHYYYDILTNKSLFQLNKTKDIYQTQKPKDLIKLQIGMVQLVQIIQTLINICKNQEGIDNIDFLNKFYEEIQIIAKKNNFSYETVSIIQLMFNYVISKLTNTKFQSKLQTNFKTTQQQPQKTINKQNQKLFDFNKMIEQQNIDKKIINYCLQFLQKLFFYNCIISMFTFFNKIDLPSQLFLNFTSQNLNKFSHTNIKIALFTKTINQPKLLMRLFNQSVNFKIASSVTKLFLKCNFTMNEFYQKICPLQQQEEKIKLYIKYQYHFLFYCLQIALDTTQKQSLILREVYNYQRMLVSTFIGHFAIKTLKVIDDQIKQIHNKYFYKRFEQKKMKDQKFNVTYNKLISSINKNSQRLYQYLYPKNHKQISINTKYFQQQHKDLKQLFNKLYSQFKQSQIKLITQEKQQIIKIHQHLTNMLKKNFFNEKVFQSFYNKLCKQIGLNFSFKSFIQKSIPKPKSIQQNNLLQKKMSQLIKQFKIGQISILKIFNMFRVIQFNSFTNQLETYNKCSQQKSFTIPKSYQQILTNMDIHFIDPIKKRRICNSLLKDPQTSDEYLNSVLELQYNLSKHINKLYNNNQPNINLGYLKSCLEYRSSNLGNDNGFIPTKSYQSFVEMYYESLYEEQQRQQQGKNKYFVAQQTKEQSKMNKQKIVEATRISKQQSQIITKQPKITQKNTTLIDQFTRTQTLTTQKTQTQQQYQTKQQQQKINNYINKLKTHPYTLMIKQKQNTGINYNFDLNKIITPHIHKNRLSIFSAQQTKQLMNHLYQTFYLPDLGNKSTSSSMNDRLNKFVLLTLNMNVGDFIVEKRSQKSIQISGEFSKKDISLGQSASFKYIEQSELIQLTDQIINKHKQKYKKEGQIY